MYDDLVKRLRDDEAWKNCDFDFIYGWMHEAADAIEELSTQLECLKSYTGKYKEAYIEEHDARIAECKREFMEKEQEAHNAFSAMTVKCGQMEPQKKE